MLDVLVPLGFGVMVLAIIRLALWLDTRSTNKKDDTHD